MLQQFLLNNLEAIEKKKSRKTFSFIIKYSKVNEFYDFEKVFAN